VMLGFSFADMPVGISDTTVTGAGGRCFGRYDHRSCEQVDSSEVPFGASRHRPLEPGRRFHRMEHRVELRPMLLRPCQAAMRRSARGALIVRKRSSHGGSLNSRV
jgi:hypothetical protein